MAMSDRQSSAQRVAPATPVDVSLFEENGLYILRSQDGMALYRYDIDVDGRSHCIDACSRRWPPLIASVGATPEVGEWRTIDRDPARQWSFRGHPVYTYALDKPGAQAGDGIDGVWHVIAP
jgi:predicted lipoprotein with Yx(FWY)xxD motif